MAGTCNLASSWETWSVQGRTPGHESDSDVAEDTHGSRCEGPRGKSPKDVTPIVREVAGGLE
eukprot:15463713-Alexandrium_andersonii.AAC.1